MTGVVVGLASGKLSVVGLSLNLSVCASVGVFCVGQQVTLFVSLGLLVYGIALLATGNLTVA